MDQDENRESEKVAALLHDIETLSMTALQAKYRQAYNSYRNRKHRAGAENWAPEFKTFTNFLRIMGAPEPGQTLDRKDNNNPVYAPDLVKWSSPREQANNRTTTVFIDHQGKPTPLSEVARSKGVNPDTLRQALRRHDKSQSFDSFIRAVEANLGYDPRPYHPWPADKSADWEKLYQESGALERRTPRYVFLITNLKTIARQVANELYSLYDRDVAVDDPLYQEKLARERRVGTAIQKAEREFPIWKRAAQNFEKRREAQRIEKAALKGDYFKLPTENDDDGF